MEERKKEKKHEYIRWKIYFSMLRSTQIISFYAILNRINYAFYNATEILKIIDVDSEMISGIIFVIYEDIFMSLFLAFQWLLHHISYAFAAVTSPKEVG